MLTQVGELKQKKFIEKARWCQERGVKLSKKRTLWDSIVEKDFRGPAPDSVFGGLESSLLLLLPWSSLLPPLNALED
jgi:hypothetical protein